MQARFVGGSPNFISVPFASAVSAGDVIVSGDLVLIAHNDVAAGKMGRYAIGGGEYEAACSEDIAFGTALMWDASAEQAKKDTSGTVVANLGFAIDEDDAGTIKFYHQNGGVRQ